MLRSLKNEKKISSPLDVLMLGPWNARITKTVITVKEEKNSILILPFTRFMVVILANAMANLVFKQLLANYY